MIFTINECMNKVRLSSLHAVQVLNAMVSTLVETIETRDNGNIIMLRLMQENERKKIENPYLPMADAAFRDAVESYGEDSSRIIDHKKMLERSISNPAERAAATTSTFAVTSTRRSVKLTA